MVFPLYLSLSFGDIFTKAVVRKDRSRSAFESQLLVL